MFFVKDDRKMYIYKKVNNYIKMLEKHIHFKTKF